MPLVPEGWKPFTFLPSLRVPKDLFPSGFSTKYTGHFPSPRCVRLQYTPVKHFFFILQHWPYWANYTHFETPNIPVTASWRCTYLLCLKLSPWIRAWRLLKVCGIWPVTVRIMSDSDVTPVAGTHFKLRFFIAVQSRFFESRLFEVPCRLSLYLKGVFCVLNYSNGFDFRPPPPSLNS